jgi:hypothetical protein
MTRRREQLGLVALMLVCIALAVAGETHIVGWWGATPSDAAQMAGNDPRPALFSTDQVAAATSLVDPADARAHALMQQWWSQADGTKPDDAAFKSWVAKVFPAPVDRTLGFPQLASYADHRRPDGITAAGWLGRHGARDVWEVAAKQHSGVIQALPETVSSTLTLAGRLADEHASTFDMQVPYLQQPDLRPHQRAGASQRLVPSYPSSAAASAAAGRAVLARLDPADAAHYRSLEAQVDYARMYVAAAAPVDVSAGAVLGDMVAEYELVTRAGFKPAQLG